MPKRMIMRMRLKHTYRRGFLKAACIVAAVVFGFNLAAAAAVGGQCSAMSCCGHCAPADSGPAKWVPINATDCCHATGDSSCRNNSARPNGNGSQPAAVGFSALPDPNPPAFLDQRHIPDFREASVFPSTAFTPELTFSQPLFLTYGILIC